MPHTRTHVCPASGSWGLDNRLRRWLQPPRPILEPFVRPGMTALDVGCGPGYFSLELADLVGPAGRVVAADLQQAMLDKVAARLAGTPLAGRVTLHRCAENALGWGGPVDFVLAFYMVHELPDAGPFFAEVAGMLAPAGRLLLVEPPFHVSRAVFQQELDVALSAGLRVLGRPRITLSKAALLGRD